MAKHIGSALTSASPEKAAARILSPAGLQAWWIGNPKVDRVDADWPAVGSHMAWRYGGEFDAEVIENALPARIVTKVRSPSGEGIVTHTFERTPEGGTRYEKIVESNPSGIMGKLFDPILGSMVRKEAKRAAKDASESR